ncbi:MAG: EAL domain-containing protein [Gammaproteobacteria bacterium]|nr:EAL domain-containing protein [Gammaproteobacteria bacterium]MBU1980051.1 EAL domain-containing protein [Gammaproteobacteria bacterium]
MNKRLEISLDQLVIKLRDELYDRDQQIALFKEVVAAVRERLDLETIFRMVATFAQGLIKAETVLIPVLDENCSTYTYRAGCGLHAEEIVGESLDLNMGICGWVWKHQRPWWRGVLKELSAEECNKWEKEVGSVILVPLVGRNHFLGGIAGINKIGGGDFDQRDLDLLTLLASQIATAIDNNNLIVQLENANQALFSEKEKILVTLSSIGDAVITTDIQGRIEYLNPVAEQLFAAQLDEARTKQLAELGSLLFEDSRQPANDLVAHCLREGRLSPSFRTLILVGLGGREIYIEPTAAPIRGHDGQASGVVLVFRDVSQARELAQQLSYQTTHDALTGLLNRHEFEYQVKQAIRDAQVNGREHSLLHLDVDQFKVINDTCGHVAGDELLKLYTVQLSGLLRQGDILARVGGDEFGLLLENCSVQQALHIAGKIQEVTQNFRFVWDGSTFSIGISIGLIGIDRESESVMSILSRVDAACHMAKEVGRNNIYVHDEEDQALHARHGEMQWTPRISKALEEQRMVLYYQSIVHCDAPADLNSHYEILIRMLDESGQLIPPGSFLPAAERYNLIATIDRWVISTYFRWLAEHPAHLKALEFGSVNLSGRSLGDAGCLIHIENQLKEFAIPAEKICFEITETEAIGNLVKAQYFIERLKSHGCSFALDDFGSGLSSYAYLKNLPVDFLKIDGVFVKDIASDPTNHAMVESINHIGHVMGRKTIAEFVENQSIMKILGELGVDYMQGYGIATPRPLGELS